MVTRFKRSSKFQAERTSHAGYSFASKLEAAVFDELMLLKKAGKIKDIKVQSHVELSRAKIKYIADFICIDDKDKIFYVEAKGYETPEWRLKLRLWEAYGPAKLIIYGGSYKKPKLIKEINPEGWVQVTFDTSLHNNQGGKI